MDKLSRCSSLWCYWNNGSLCYVQPNQENFCYQRNFEYELYLKHIYWLAMCTCQLPCIIKQHVNDVIIIWPLQTAGDIISAWFEINKGKNPQTYAYLPFILNPMSVSSITNVFHFVPAADYLGCTISLEQSSVP